MRETLQLLVTLQDLDVMIKEASDPNSMKQEEQMGFKLEGLEKLKSARKRIADKIAPWVLDVYERVSKRYGRAVVPVGNGGVCLGCFVTLPTSSGSTGMEHKELQRCENCGRILYWL